MYPRAILYLYTQIQSIHIDVNIFYYKHVYIILQDEDRWELNSWLTGQHLYHRSQAGTPAPFAHFPFHLNCMDNLQTDKFVLEGLQIHEHIEGWRSAGAIGEAGLP